MSNQRDKILQSSFILIGTKWAQRLLGLVSFFVLARILGPEDFGIVSLSFIVLSFFDALASTGGYQFILRKTSVSDNDLNVAFTLEVLFKCFVSLTVFLLAHPISEFFGDSRLEWVLKVSSCIPIIEAVTNPGVAHKQRDYDYRAIALISISTKLASFAITLFLAIRYESYWALIAGNITSAITFTFLSYQIHPFRPRFSLIGASKQWLFSKWMWARSIVGFSRSKMDQLIVGMSFELSVVGAYNVSKELVLMPVTQISEPLSPLFLSMFSSAKNDINELRKSYSVKFLIMLAVMFPITIGMYILREELVTLLLGAKWIGTEVILGHLSLLVLTYAMSASSTSILMVLDKMRVLVVLEIVTLLIIVVGQFMARNMDIETFALIRSVLGIFTFLAYFLTVTSALKIHYGYFVKGLIPVLIANGALWVCLLELSRYFDMAALLLTSVIFGGAVYITTLVFAMRLFGSQHQDVELINEISLNYFSRFRLRFSS